ncbi:CYTH domain-containing protein [Acidihalobacter prosperus]
MPTEIERKFLVTSDEWRQHVSKSSNFRQGYLGAAKTSSVRVRLSDDNANLNIKSVTLGVSRLEYEYQIPVKDAQEMLDKLCHKPLIEKVRHIVYHEGHCWEIDEFYGINQGLIVAEIELDSVDEQFSLPEWAGREVTDEARYYNVALALTPYSEWKDTTQ